MMDYICSMLAAIQQVRRMLKVHNGLAQLGVYSFGTGIEIKGNFNAVHIEYVLQVYGKENVLLIRFYFRTQDNLPEPRERKVKH